MSFISATSSVTKHYTLPSLNFAKPPHPIYLKSSTDIRGLEGKDKLASGSRIPSLLVQASRILEIRFPVVDTNHGGIAVSGERPDVELLVSIYSRLSKAEQLEISEFLERAQREQCEQALNAHQQSSCERS